MIRRFFYFPKSHVSERNCREVMNWQIDLKGISISFRKQVLSYAMFLQLMNLSPNLMTSFLFSRHGNKRMWFTNPFVFLIQTAGRLLVSVTEASSTRVTFKRPGLLMLDLDCLPSYVTSFPRHQRQHHSSGDYVTHCAVHTAVGYKGPNRKGFIQWRCQQRQFSIQEGIYFVYPGVLPKREMF